MFITLFLALVVELPTSSYEKLQKNAEESIVIKVESVETYKYNNWLSDVIIHTKVFKVNKSSNNIKVDDKIIIKYRSPFRQPDFFVGPKLPLVLKKGRVYKAFLIKIKDTTEFAPAAYGESFLDFSLINK